MGMPLFVIVPHECSSLISVNSPDLKPYQFVVPNRINHNTIPIVRFNIDTLKPKTINTLENPAPTVLTCNQDLPAITVIPIYATQTP